MKNEELLNKYLELSRKAYDELDKMKWLAYADGDMDTYRAFDEAEAKIATRMYDLMYK